MTCDRVVFIKDGEVVANWDLQTLVDREVRVAVRARKLTPETVAGLTPWTVSPHLNGEELTLVAQHADALPHILRHLVASGADVYKFAPERLTLEELFVQIVGEDRGL